MTSHECSECQFVAHRSNIVVTPLQREQVHLTPKKILRAFYKRQSLEDYIIPVGRFTLPGWSGHAMWYLFECSECQTKAVDYLHGHRHFLICDGCETRFIVTSRRFYEETGVAVPFLGDGGNR